MSTKIYNGYIMDVPVAEAFAKIRDTRETFCKSETFRNSAWNAEFRKLMPVIVDMLCNKSTANDENVWFQSAVQSVVPLESEYAKTLPERLGLATFRRTPIVWALRLTEALCAVNEKTHFTFEYDSDVSLDMKLLLFPHPRGEAKTMILFYGGEAPLDGKSGKTLRDAFVEASGMRDFSYWDCTDGPSEIPENLWRERGKLWDEAIPSIVPSKDGLGYVIFSTERDRISPMSIEYVEKRYVEAREDSIRRVANASLTAKLFDSKGDGAQNYHTAYEAICSANEQQKQRTEAYLAEERHAEKLIPTDFQSALETLGAKETVMIPMGDGR